MQYANPVNFLWQYNKLLALGISNRWQLVAKLLCGDCFTATVILDLRTKHLSRAALWPLHHQPCLHSCSYFMFSWLSALDMFLNRKRLNLICRAVALLLRVLQMLLRQTHTPKYLKCSLQEKDSLCFQNNSPNVQSQMSKYTRQDMEYIFSALRTQTISASCLFCTTFTCWPEFLLPIMCLPFDNFSKPKAFYSNSTVYTAYCVSYCSCTLRHASSSIITLRLPKVSIHQKHKRMWSMNFTRSGGFLVIFWKLCIMSIFA